MIGRLTGSLVECSTDLALVDVGGVGYEVRIPLSTFYALSGQSGQRVSLHVHTHVREEALQLYGFIGRAERKAFEQLIAIGGVGPRLALAILSGIGVEDLWQAVTREDRARLQKIPGVGRKTAERVMLELRDRMKLDRGEPPPAGGDGRIAVEGGGVVADAVSALVNLGYPESVARRAVTANVEHAGPDPDLESVLRGALASLVR